MNFEQPRTQEAEKSPEELQEIGKRVMADIEQLRSKIDELEKRKQESPADAENIENMLDSLYPRLETLEGLAGEELPQEEAASAEAAEA